MTEYRKAIAAFVVTAAGNLGLALADGNITVTEGLAALGTTLVATAAVYGFKNE